MKAKKALITAICIMIGLVVAGACLVGAGYGTSKSWDMSNWFEGDLFNNDGDTSNGDTSIAELPQQLLFRSKALSTAEGNSILESYTFRATICPEDTVDKRVEWSIAWVSDTAQNINDYFEVNAEDGSNVASIGCKKSFGNLVARITVSACAGLYTSTCMVYYANAPTESTVIGIGIDNTTLKF